jgi:hypothetical protein
VATMRARRHETMRGLVAIIGGKQGFARKLDTARAADILYALVSEESYRLLCSDRGWNTTEWQTWVTDSLTHTYFPAPDQS